MRIPFTYSATKEVQGVPYAVRAAGLMGYACGEMNVELFAVSFYHEGTLLYKWNHLNKTLVAAGSMDGVDGVELMLSWIERDEEQRLMKEWRAARKSTCL